MAPEAFLAVVTAGVGRGSFPLRSAQGVALWVKPGRFGVPLLQTSVLPDLQERDNAGSQLCCGVRLPEASRGLRTSLSRGLNFHQSNHPYGTLGLNYT